MPEAFGQRLVFCGIADGETAGRHIPGDDGSGGYHGSGTDGDAFQDNGPGSDETAFSDVNGLAVPGISPRAAPAGAAPGIVHVVVQNQRVCAYQRMAPDVDAVDANQGGSADAAAVLHGDAGFIGKGRQAGMVGKDRIHPRHGVDGDAVADGDASSRKFFNPGQSGQDDARSGTHSPELEQQAAYL